MLLFCVIPALAFARINSGGSPLLRNKIPSLIITNKSTSLTIFYLKFLLYPLSWIPVFTGMTNKERFLTIDQTVSSPPI